MAVEFGIKISRNNFCYPLTGFKRNVLYNAHNRTLLLTDAEDGSILQEVERDEDLDFETFVLVARNIFLDVVEYSN